MRLLLVLSACACVCACLGLNCIRPIGTQTHTVCLEGAPPAAHTAAQPRTHRRCACKLSWMDGVFHGTCTWFVVCCVLALIVPVSFCAEQAAHHTPCHQPSCTVAGRPFHPLLLTSFRCFVGLTTPLNDRLRASVLASVDAEECLLPCVVQRSATLTLSKTRRHSQRSAVRPVLASSFQHMRTLFVPLATASPRLWLDLQHPLHVRVLRACLRVLASAGDLAQLILLQSNSQELPVFHQECGAF